MPSVQAPGTILVTGASGFIGTWLVKDLLERGYNVRVAVRTPESAEFLKTVSPKHSGQVTYTIVKDIEPDNAFDDAVKGVDAVLHLATPVTPFLSASVKAQDVIGPAVAGTLGLFKSIQQFAPTVKRVIITSSAVSVGWFNGTKILDENDWNDNDVKTAESSTTEVGGALAYSASKTLAEKAAFQFVKDNSGLLFDVVYLLPAYVFGPILHRVASPDKLNVSQLFFYSLLQEVKPGAESTSALGSFVDVRDVATLHSLALTSDKAGGERFIAASGTFAQQEILDIVNSGIATVTKGTPGSTNKVETEYSNKKTLATFPNFKFKTLEESVKDTVKEFVARGWLA